MQGKKVHMTPDLLFSRGCVSSTEGLVLFRVKGSHLVSYCEEGAESILLRSTGPVLMPARQRSEEARTGGKKRSDDAGRKGDQERDAEKLKPTRGERGSLKEGPGPSTIVR